MSIAPSVEKLKKKQQRQGERKGDLAPNPVMWKALEEGALLGPILEHFYKLVFSDEKLAHFFDSSTQARARDKQFLFMKAIFTGEKCYFGERPRNAHSWMVISDDLFDYREDLLAKVLQKYGLNDELIKQWRAVDEVYRKQIVKAEPIVKRIDGVELPVDGYQSDIIDSGTVCDACEQAIDAGSEVSYHVRTGKTYCSGCTR
jgi:truncated hemoglobin YjbI